MDRTIIEFLTGLADQATEGSSHISFHMPGHKGRSALYERAGYGSFLRNIMACDITEIPGADSLFCPESTIRSVMDDYAELYGVRRSELLVNGSTAGVMASIISSVPIGGKLILGRNSHSSAFNAMRLWGVNPVYIRPETDDVYGLSGCIDPSSLEKACRDNPDASAVLITSPNYYGMLSDIAALADIAHEAGMLLIVDQAHGAHLKFFDLDAEDIRSSGGYVTHARHSAESLGADLVINSTHKTLLSFTGSGILNICTDEPDIKSVSETLKMLQTTSPSYLLMGSLDINRRIMAEYGSDIVKKWRSDLTDFYRRAQRIDGLDIITCPIENDREFALYHNKTGLDMSKINISMARLGLSGERLENELRSKGIIPEMVHGEFVLLMTGAGNVTSDYDRLLTVLREISDSYGVAASGSSAPLSSPDFVLDSADIPVEYEEIPLYMADGRILYDPVVIYPPGTPVACPGEIMNAQVISYIAQAIEREDKVIGVDEEGMIKVGTER